MVDNTALALAMQQCASVVPLFVFDPGILESFQRPDGRIHFLWETLNEIKRELQERGSDLLVLFGKSEEIVAQCCRVFGCDACFRNRSYGR